MIAEDPNPNPNPPQNPRLARLNRLRRLRQQRPKILHPLLFKAQKNLDLPTSSIHLLNPEEYQKLSRSTLKLLLSKHSKRRPFGQVALGLKNNKVFNKSMANNIKKFSIWIRDVSNDDGELGYCPTKSEEKLLKTLLSSDKHLENLNVKTLSFQKKTSLKSIAKLNRLQNLSMNLSFGYPHRIPPKFLQNLRHLQHLTLAISIFLNYQEATLENFLRSLTILPSLESYNIDIHIPSAPFKKSVALMETIFSFFSLIKAKRFLLKIHCIEAFVELIRTFKSFLENIDTFKCIYHGVPDAYGDFGTTPSKKLILVLSLSPQSERFETILDHCSSLENLYLEQHRNSVPPAKLNLPQTLKSLILKLATLEFIEDLPQFVNAWENQFSKLKNLENLSLLLASPCKKVVQWISQLSLKGLKSYHLKLEDRSLEQEGGEDYHRDFLLKWSENLRSFCTLEDLSIEITSFRLDSLEFVTKALANLPKLKRIRLDLNLHHKQPREMLKLLIPCENLPQLEYFWLTSYQFLSKNSAPKLLQEIVQCENLQSFKVSGLDFDFDETTAISVVKKLSHLKELEITNERKDVLTLNSKKQIVKKNTFVKTRDYLSTR